MTPYNTALDQNPARLSVVVNRRRSSGIVSKAMASINLAAFQWPPSPAPLAGASAQPRARP